MSYRLYKRGGLVHADAYCTECDWTASSKNAMGLAAQHVYRTGHEVRVEIGSAFTFSGSPIVYDWEEDSDDEW